MKYFPLIWSSVWRKPVRTTLLYVGPAVYGEPPLPLADLSRLRSIPGVKAVSFNQGMLTFYQKPTQPVYVLGIQPIDLMRTMLPEASPTHTESFREYAETGGS